MRTVRALHGAAISTVDCPQHRHFGNHGIESMTHNSTTYYANSTDRQKRTTRLGTPPAVSKTISIGHDGSQKVMFVIVTDGLENASAPGYTKERLVAKIKGQTEVYNWVFLYLGADQDAIAVAQSYGIAADKAVYYERQKSRETGDVLAAKMRMMAEYDARAMKEIAFNEEDRKKLKK